MVFYLQVVDGAGFVDIGEGVFDEEEGVHIEQCLFGVTFGLVEIGQLAISEDVIVFVIVSAGFGIGPGEHGLGSGIVAGEHKGVGKRIGGIYHGGIESIEREADGLVERIYGAGVVALQDVCLAHFGIGKCNEIYLAHGVAYFHFLLQVLHGAIGLVEGDVVGAQIIAGNGKLVGQVGLQGSLIGHIEIGERFGVLVEAEVDHAQAVVDIGSGVGDAAGFAVHVLQCFVIELVGSGVVAL